MRVFLGSVGLIFVLAACEAPDPIATAFPERQSFEFETADGTAVMRYKCEVGADSEETEQRAASAHEFVDTSLTTFATEYAAQAVENGDLDLETAEQDAAIFAEQVVQDAETQYQCFFYDREAF
ncbi:hypothetical protein [Pseudaestuariivita rosea]|uniref:hypothetical protein n=1 Tax=Pseudaestuariivita rosea TaxID=2763263 RepID=UPI001ABA8556|nr:hypothetical protein [Pseudaestuariivita rosea]